MRLVAVADTHTFEDHLGAIPAGDVFIHAGDLLRGGTLEELAPVAAWIGALSHPHKIVVAGNHDFCFERAELRERAIEMLGAGVHYLQDSGVTIGGRRFWGSPWQPAYNDWAFNLPRGAPLAERWAEIPRDTDVLITHGPPLGFGDRGPVPGRTGCADLIARVREVAPLVHLFGHIHQDGGLFREGATHFANVTTWECERAPTVLDIDTHGVLTPVQVPEASTLPA